MKKILIVAPHPDDAELAMGGTIAKMLDSRCMAQQVLNYRQYFFGLLPEEILRDMLHQGNH